MPNSADDIAGRPLAFGSRETDAGLKAADVLVLVSADAEWQAVEALLRPAQVERAPHGEFFRQEGILYLKGGWGKIAAAASAQYALDRFSPSLLVNLGTCGGFEGQIERGAVILATKTIVYDIFEQMSDPQEAIAHYSTELDLSWLPAPPPVPIRRAPLLSADRDILPGEIPGLVETYRAAAADWESGAIAWVAKRNGTRCLILRGVSDLVGPSGGEAYGNIELFRRNTREIMKALLDLFHAWLPALTGGRP